MYFDKEVCVGRLIKRYKRFFADVELDSGELVTAHCPNTGSMKSCGSAGDTVILTKNNNPKRKLRYTWELTKIGDTYIGVNTALANPIVREALEGRIIEPLSSYRTIRAEVRYGNNCRIDFLLSESGLPNCYVEVKNVTLGVGKKALFPDAVTTRGLKHLVELTQVVKAGEHAVMLYLVNRNDVEHFCPAWDIDSAYCKELLRAQKAGVKILAYQTKASEKGIWLSKPIPYSISNL